MSALEPKSDWFTLKLRLLIQLFRQYELELHYSCGIFTNASRRLPSLEQIEHKLI